MTGTAPSMGAIEQFWRAIWETEGHMNNENQWIKEVEDQLRMKVQEPHIPQLLELHNWKKIVMKRKNWTGPGPDGVQNYWITKITVLWHMEIAAIRKLQKGVSAVPEWLGEGRTVLIPKSNDRTQVDKYRPITCLNTLYKVLTAVIAQDIQMFLTSNKMWDNQQKGTQRRILGTVDNLIVDRAVLEECKQYERNLAVAYFDYEKAYDSIPHEWQIKCFQMCQINNNVIQILRQLHSIWRTKYESMRKCKEVGGYNSKEGSFRVIH